MVFLRTRIILAEFPNLSLLSCIDLQHSQLTSSYNNIVLYILIDKPKKIDSKIHPQNWVQVICGSEFRVFLKPITALKLCGFYILRYNNLQFPACPYG